MASALPNTEPKTRSYFVVKCRNIDALKKCYETGKWACRDQVSPPHPQCILSSSLHNHMVILIFSVNNCHGWHGYCEMIDSPVADDVESDSGAKNDNINQISLETYSNSGEVTEKQTEKTEWFYFNVQWKTIFLKEFGEQCLSSNSTEDFTVANGVQVNKARNWQELPEEIGRRMCDLIDEYYAKLKQMLQAKLDAQASKRPAAFLTSNINENDQRYWQTIVSKVEEELGQVHLACPFGSQRYNLHGPDSDVDVFVVYQAHTKEIIGFNPPKQTIKNSDKEGCDYTILELHRYCDLLASGDPRCVETLFLHPSTIVKCSQQWRKLREKSQVFLTRQCLDKYLRDGLGSNGVKQLMRWKREHAGRKEKLPAKINKLVYIILRLLQNARDIIQGGPLKVFREVDTEEYQILMSIRQGEKTFDDMWLITKSIIDEVEEGKDNIITDTMDSKNIVENWLLHQRYDDFHLHSPVMI